MMNTSWFIYDRIEHRNLTNSNRDWFGEDMFGVILE
jgi:hypothetical protein